MVALSKAIIPTVTQNAVSLQLAEASMNAEKALNDLKQSAEKVKYLSCLAGVLPTQFGNNWIIRNFFAEVH